MCYPVKLNVCVTGRKYVKHTDRKQATQEKKKSE